MTPHNWELKTIATIPDLLSLTNEEMDAIANQNTPVKTQYVKSYRTIMKEKAQAEGRKRQKIDEL